MTFPDFEEFIALLNAHRALVDRTLANARGLNACLLAFLGGAAPNITEAKLMDPRTLVVLGVAAARIEC